jgi:hypothetical protein
MPTLAELRSEPWWDREIVTPEVRWLGAELCRRTGRPADAFGAKGNTAHLRGAHRSQEWLINSRWCTNRSYTVQAGLTGDQLRYIAGVDWTPGNVEAMIAQSRRLMAAVKSGALEAVRELYCNVDGDKVVDGWDNVRDRAASSDSSHLWHWHLSLDRRRLRDGALMAQIVDIALGTWKGDGDMAQPSTSEVVRLLTQGSDDEGFVAKTDRSGTPSTEGVGPAGQYNLKAVEERLSTALKEVAQGLKAELAELRELVQAGGTDPQVIEDAAFRGAQRAERE